MGMETHEYQPTMMHAKTIVVDGVWSMFGSANFDNRSLELNDELNVAVWNRLLASALLRDFERDLQVCAQIRLERVASPPARSKRSRKDSGAISARCSEARGSYWTRRGQTRMSR